MVVFAKGNSAVSSGNAENYFDISTLKKAVILDTSFYVALNQDQAWALSAVNIINREHLKVIVPEGIFNECMEIYLNERKDKFGFPLATRTIEDITLGAKTYFSLDIEAEVSKATSEGFVKFARKATFIRRNPGYIDKRLLDSVIQYARELDEVYVATADSDIYDTLNGMMAEYGNLHILNPWTAIEKGLHRFYPEADSDKTIECLFTSESLSQIRNSRSSSEYLVISKNHQISPNFQCDLAFHVMTKMFGRVLGLPEELYIIPIISVKSSDFDEGKFNNIDAHLLDNYDKYVVKDRKSGKFSIFRKVNVRLDGKSSRFSLGKLFSYRIEPWHLSYYGRKDYEALKKKLAKAL